MADVNAKINEGEPLVEKTAKQLEKEAKKAAKQAKFDEKKTKEAAQKPAASKEKVEVSKLFFFANFHEINFISSSEKSKTSETRDYL